MADTGRLLRPSFDEALAIVRAHAVPLGTEAVALADAAGRTLAQDAVAASDYPRFDAAAMDGFGLAAINSAVASAARPVVLTIAGDARAGGPVGALAPGTAVRISTGAAIPHGCDAILPLEEAQLDRDRLLLDGQVVEGRNIRKRGEDACAGDLVIASGAVMTPAMIGALACYGVESVAVSRRPTLAIVPTGDELLTPPGPGQDGAIFDANTVMIAALAKQWDLVTNATPAVGDDPSALERAIDAAAMHADIVVTTGGAAAGDHDHLSTALRALGATVHFHGARMRPGKPVLFATLPSGALFFGLPGNPVAALLGARFFLKAGVRAVQRHASEVGDPIDPIGNYRRDTTLVLKARGRADRDGPHILSDQRSHTMRPLIEADCWVVTHEDKAGRRSCRVFPLF